MQRVTHVDRGQDTFIGVLPLGDALVLDLKLAGV